jgi:hypothetical protein
VNHRSPSPNNREGRKCGSQRLFTSLLQVVRDGDLLS